MVIYNSETSGTQYYEGGCSMYEMEVGPTQHIYYWIGVCLTMATTGELLAIMQELHLVDVGDAASYLGEEATVEEESLVSAQPAPALISQADVLIICDSTARCCVTTF